ncbi:MAG: flagellar biosynthesis anti-sigma factor FlgM [Planctomycetia bacterium]|nr:flagellar biosynthesis anti-sigma factor FlgM [Planctomycetia bacterium]
MQVYGPAHLHGPQSISAPHTPAASRSQSSDRSAPIQDEVQISSQGEIMSRMADIPEIRHDKVAALRAAIADGSYETDAKLSGALDRLLDEIG